MNMNRRDFLKAGVLGAGAAALAGSAPGLFAQNANDKPVRLGIIGTGSRGTGHITFLMQMEGVVIPAVCDINEGSLNHAAALIENATGNAPAKYTGDDYAYRKMLQRDDLDAVLIATPIRWHLDMAIDALKAGKHVASEVTAGYDLGKLWELVRTVQQTGKHYMLLENYIFSGENMMIYNMAQQGLFGDPYFAECSYIHNCKSLAYNADGSLNWRGLGARDYYGNLYSTHSLGPVSKWLGINDGDRMVSLTCTASDPRCRHEYAVKRFGPDSPQAKIMFKAEDFIATTIRTAQGRVIQLDYDTASPRPASIYYAIQGTKGVFDSRQGIYLETEGAEDRWTNANDYWEKHQHPIWKELGPQAAKTSHGGGDFFVLRHFLRMVRENTAPWIDVYDATAWSVIQHCSVLSLDNANASIDIPDFTEGRWESKDWRKDNLKPSV